jgi:hypothetical protein
VLRNVSPPVSCVWLKLYGTISYNEVSIKMRRGLGKGREA